MNDLAPFVLALRGRIERDLEDNPAMPDAPNAMDAIDRALAIDEHAVPEGLRESAAAGSDHDESVSERPDDALAPFAAALRQRVEGIADARRLEPLPDTRRAARWPWIAGIAAVAAAVAIAVLSPAFETQSIAERVRSDFEAAERSIANEREPEQAIARERSMRRAPSTSTRAVEPAPTIVAPTPETSGRKPRIDRADLGELEARAHTKWKAGDLAGAESLLRQVIRRSGRTRRAELAYADLFALAHQRGGEAAQSKVWRAYLARFPRGRFADDVRAGLCRRADAGQRSACWSNYLEHHPHGAHAGQARKAVATQPR